LSHRKAFYHSLFRLSHEKARDYSVLQSSSVLTRGVVPYTHVPYAAENLGQTFPTG